jgi:hypothetical protein
MDSKLTIVIAQATKEEIITEKIMFYHVKEEHNAKQILMAKKTT